MALFNKFFFPSSNRRKIPVINSTQSSQTHLSRFPFESHQVRIVLYRECDARGRRLLFDSSAIQKSPMTADSTEHSMTTTKNCNDSINTTKPFKNKTKTYSKCEDECINISNGFVYKHNRPSTSDITNIGEMVFGALAMSFRATALKVHWLKTPSPQLLCSQVFLSPVRSDGNFQHHNNRNQSGRQSISSEQGSVDGFSMNSFSVPFNGGAVQTSRKLSLVTRPLDVPDSTLEMNIAANESSSTGDSGYSGATTHCKIANSPETWQYTTANASKPYQYLIRSSTGSILSDPSESLRKLSLESVNYDPSTYRLLHSQKCSDGSMERRISRNQMTSFENSSCTSDSIGFISDNYQTATNGGSDGCVGIRYSVHQTKCSNETHSNPEICRQNKNYSNTGGDTWLNIIGGSNNTSKSTGRRSKLGLAICITMTESYEKEMEQFICEHIALLESMLCRLRALAEKAYINHKKFFQIMLAGWQSTTEWISDLLTAPRLPSPVWLTLSTHQNTNSKSVAENFMKEFCWLLRIADTKDTNFFVSTMLTAILTHHLGWVSTIYAADIENSCDIGYVSNHHPYNALWAQLGDLYGAVGSPTKTSRTIVYSSERTCMEKLLHVLTYFIRCGEVSRSTKNEFIDKESINKVLSENSARQTKSISSGLTRTQTCHKNLNEINPDIVDHPVDRQEVANQNDKLDRKFYDDIKLTVTTPENIEMAYTDAECLSFDSVVEAIEVPIELEYSTTIKRSSSSGSGVGKSLAQKLFWNLEPKIKEGLSWKDLEKLQLGVKLINKKLEKRSNSSVKINGYQSNGKSLNKPEEYGKKFSSLSDLISTEHNIIRNTEPTVNGNGVVFVLGDNEKLVNLKKSIDDIPTVPSSGTIIGGGSQQMHTCTHHKKHSGVKFNFEQYPQIATNYMKNKNIDVTNYDFNEKSRKLELNSNSNSCTTISVNHEQEFVDGSGSSQCRIPDPATSSLENCEYCNSGATYQTPSNATDFESDDNNYPSTSTFSVNVNDRRQYPINLTKLNSDDRQILSDRGLRLKKMFQNHKFCQNMQRNDVNLIQLPAPKFQEDDHKTSLDESKKTGFIPSLFVGINDHYIPDMVLQGTICPPKEWETNLKNDLTLASHSASLISITTENVAIVADMDIWEVKIVSSQTHILPYTSTASGPVGMSQLVSTMLEAVYAMNNAGISAYECLSYLESKLKEMYVQSEALAAFLLATEFCSLGAVTSSLNLSENDVPLLLSVASIHSPQVTRKYGISFR